MFGWLQDMFAGGRDPSSGGYMNEMDRASDAVSSSKSGMSQTDRKKLGQRLLAQSLAQAGQAAPMQSTGYVPMNNGQFSAGGQMIGGR